MPVNVVAVGSARMDMTSNKTPDAARSALSVARETRAACEVEDFFMWLRVRS